MILNCAIQHNNSTTNRYHIAVQYVKCLKKLLFSLCVMILLCGTFVSWWYLPRIWPYVTDMQHYYHARYSTDDWHLAYMFSLVYFSVEVCLVGVFPNSVSTRRDPCVRVNAPPPSHWLPPSRKNNNNNNNKKSNRGWPSSPLQPSEGDIWTDAWICLHY